MGASPGDQQAHTAVPGVVELIIHLQAAIGLYLFTVHTHFKYIPHVYCIARAAGNAHS